MNMMMMMSGKTKNNKKMKEYKQNVPNLEISEKERNSSIKLMESIFKVQSTSGNMEAMSSFIYNFVDNLVDPTIDIRSDKSGNIYVTKGRADTYPCIVSHIDTVHDIIPEQDYLVLNNGLEFFAIDVGLKRPTGIGGDDNNGIYCCLDNLIREDYIKLAFFVDEEIGCVGSSACDMKFFEDVSFVLQADRQGYNDVVNNIGGTVMFGNDFWDSISDTLDDYSRTVTSGGMTDVMQLAHNGLEVAMANFSCGYYKPHTDKEYVVIDELILTSLLFRDIIKSSYTNGLVNEFTREPADIYGYSNSNKFTDYQWFGKENKSNVKQSNPDCTYCGGKLEYDESTDAYYCFGCLDYDINY